MRGCRGRPGRSSDVDRDDPAVAEQVTDAGQKARAAAEVRARLDDQVGSRLDEDLLVDPEVERALPHRLAEPGRLLPGGLCLVVEPVEGVGDRAGVLHARPTLVDRAPLSRFELARLARVLADHRHVAVERPEDGVCELGRRGDHVVD